MTEWYEFGTATVAANGTTVTLSAGALAVGNVRSGDGLIFKGSQFPPVEISEVVSNTSLTLRNPWPYAAQTNVAYTVEPGFNWSSTAQVARDVTEYLAAVSGVVNSDTTNTVGAGSKTWNVQPNLRISVGARLRFSDIAAPTTRWMEGVVTSYAGRALTATIDATLGSGSASLWNINFSGAQGPQGIQGPVGNIGTTWNTFTPTVTPGTGSFGTSPPTATGTYYDVGSLRFYSLAITFPAGYSAGSPTAGGWMTATLPAAPVGNFFGVGREAAVVGSALLVYGNSTASCTIVGSPPPSFVGGNSYSVRCNFFVRTA